MIEKKVATEEYVNSQLGCLATVVLILLAGVSWAVTYYIDKQDRAIEERIKTLEERQK